MIHLLNRAFRMNEHDYVVELYRQLLNREPDEAYLHYVNRLLSGGTRIDILLTILQSDEAVQLYHPSHSRYAHHDQAPTIAWRLQAMFSLDDERFVQSLYNELLDREPEEAGRSFFLHLLSQGHSRFSLFVHVLTAEECLGAPSGLPGALYKVRDWVAANDDRDRGLKLYRPFFEGQWEQLYEAKSLDQPVREQFRAASYPTPLTFAAVIPRGRAWGINGDILTWDNCVLDVTPLNIGKEHVSLFHQWVPIPHNYTPDTIGVLTYTSNHNYFHWMFDVLPRIYLLNGCGVPIDKLLVNRGGYSPFQDQLLALMGITSDKIIDTHSHFHIKARMLVVTSHVSFSYPKWICDFLRSQLLLNRHVPAEPQYERIYISRIDAAGRKISNEPEIIGLLHQYGFCNVILSTLPVEKQILIFASAQVVVAPHGAGLSNLVFCKPGTKVIELLSPNHVMNFYWIISNNVKLDYYYMIGDVYDTSGSSAANYSVSVDKLKHTLRLAGVETR